MDEYKNSFFCCYFFLYLLLSDIFVFLEEELLCLFLPLELFVFWLLAAALEEAFLSAASSFSDDCASDSKVFFDSSF